jgi:hypothetical protein
VPLGRPVEPDEYSQKAGSSRPVGAGFWSGECALVKASKSISAGCSGESADDAAFSGARGCETITFCTSWSLLTRAALSAGSSAPLTSTACARECSSM